MLVSTLNDLPHHRVVKHIGLCRGVTVRSRNVIGNWVGGLQSIFGGKLGIYTKLAEQARAEALRLMTMNATELGANAVLGMRYDATEIMDGITEVLAYGTAVVVEPLT